MTDFSVISIKLKMHSRLRHIFFILCCFLLQKSFAAKNNTLDSLKTVLSLSNSDSAKAKTLVLIIKEFLNRRDYPNSDANLRELEKISSKAGFKSGTANYHLLKGRLLYYQFNFDEAFIYFEKARLFFKEINDFDSFTQANYCIGLVYFSKGDQKKADSIYREALAKKDLLKDKKILSTIYGNLAVILISQSKDQEAIANLKKAEEFALVYNRPNLGTIYTAYANIYHNQALSQESLKYMFKSLKISEEFNDLTGIAVTYNNIASTYLNLGNLTEALKNSLISLSYAKKAGDKRLMAAAYINLGNINGMKKNFNEAFKNFTIADELFAGIGNKRGIAQTSARLADILVDKDSNYTAALEKYKVSLGLHEQLDDVLGIAKNKASMARAYLKLKDYKNSEVNLMEAVEISKKINARENLRTSYEIWSRLRSAQEKYKEALYYFNLYKLYSDSILLEANSTSINQVQVQFDFEKKETLAKAEYENQKNISDLEIKRQQTIRYAFTAGFALVLLLALVIYRSLRQNKRKNAIILKQKELVDEKQKEILDSIHYAKRIQTALLPHEKYIERNLDKLNKK